MTTPGQAAAEPPQTQDVGGGSVDAARTSTAFSRIRARAELVLGPIELHAHHLLARSLDERELTVARTAAETLVQGLGDLQLHGLAQLGRQVLRLLDDPDPDEALGVEIAGAIEDIRTMLASAVAQLEDTPSLGGTVLAVGEASASFDATLWVLANHGHTVDHVEHQLPRLQVPPEVVVVNVGRALDAAAHTTLRAVGETYVAPVLVLHDDLGLEEQAEISRYCSTLLPLRTSPTVVSEEIMRLQAGSTAELHATVWGCAEAVPVLSAHGYQVTIVHSLADVGGAPYGAIVIGEKAGPKAMIDLTRLVRVSPSARMAPIVWQGPLQPAMALTAGRLGVVACERFDDAAATALTTQLRLDAADSDPASARADSMLGWAATRLLIDRSLISAQRTNTPTVVALIRLGDETRLRAPEIAELLLREFRRGDVVGSRSATDFVVALNGIGHRTALDRLGALAARVGPDVRVGVAEFPGAGRSAEDLVCAAELAIERATESAGPAVVSTSWRPAESRTADILFVDSDLVLGEMLAVALAERGLRTRVETDGHEALTLLTDTPDALPRVLMIDLDFGGAEGRALLGALRPTGLLAHMNVLVMATRASENDVRMALDLGASDVIRKPFPVALMLHRLTHLLAA